MILYLNRGLIVEQKIIEAFKTYFNSLGLADYYKNYTIHITNSHPFATLLYDEKTPTISLFPSIIVTTISDIKPGQLEQLVESTGIQITIDDIQNIKENGYTVTEKVLHGLESAFETREWLYGVSQTTRRQDTIAIEIWSENIQLKNELYETVRLFVCGFLRNYLCGTTPGHDIVIFDNTILGERSNNFNEDFGVILSGAHLTFEVDYTIEQTIIDTGIVEYDPSNIIGEVINHAKGEKATTTSLIYLGDDPGEFNP
ncbi:hypothetical protein FACS1894164_04140 [Spirochaetia bacterium]|nr:hypothetical protein FACS1894164_04140 [Spirochaetia bacterium]